jgi:ABC-type sugar transport system permease subunit
MRGRGRLALLATPALLSYLAVLGAINQRDRPAAMTALGVCVVATALLLIATYRTRPYLTFLVPPLMLYTLFMIYPAVAAFRYSLYDWSGFGEPVEFVGLQNYRDIFRDAEYPNALWNNVQLFLAVFVLQNLFGLPLAWLLDRRPRFFELYRAILFLPVIISLIATGYMWQMIFGANIGILNPLFDLVGQPEWRKDWLADDFLTSKIVWLVHHWQHLGIPLILYLAGLQAIPDDLEDAARIDGANHWQLFRHVTFPLLAPVFTVVTTTTFIGMIRTFDIPLLIGGPGGAPNGTTDVVTLVIYRAAFGVGGLARTIFEQGYAVAAGVVMFGVLLIAVALQTVLLRRREVEL